MRDTLVYFGLLFVFASACGGGEEPRKGSNENGADTSAKATSNTARLDPGDLRVASLNGNLARVQRAVEQGISIQSADETGKTALMLASYNGHTEVIRYLLDKGAEINKQDKDGRTSLMFASSGPFPDAVQLLLEEGAEPNTKDSGEGWTPLMYAAAEGNADVVKILLDHGADASIEDSDGDQAIDFATNNGHANVAALLE